MIYSNQYAVGNKPIGIASLAAVIKKAGHEFRLFDCTQFSVTKGAEYTNWDKEGEKRLTFMVPENAERFPKREKVTYSQLIEKIIADIGNYNPDMIGLTALTDDYPLGLRIMEKVKKSFPKIPTIAGGVHATIDPTSVISEDCFDMVCVGEGEYVMLDLAKRVDEGKDFFNIKNLWIKKKDGSIEKNLVRPYEQNLDKFPIPDWSIYPETAFYKPFRGHVYKYGDFEMSRGCPYKCSFCVNVQIQSIYKQTGGNYHREKSIPRVIEEIKIAIKEYKIEFVRFWDETFLLMSNERLEEFSNLYSKEIGLPFVIETTSQSVTPFAAKMLKKANCKSVSLGMETGSPDIRSGILHKPTDNEKYFQAFKLLEENNIHKVSYNMVGLPHEKQEDIFKTIAMNKLCKTDIQSVCKFYPYPGTPVRKMLKEEGLFSEKNEKELMKDYDYNTLITGTKSAVLFRDMNDNILNKLDYLFVNYTDWPVKLWPLIDIIKNSEKLDKFTNLLWNKMNDITYYKKFNRWTTKKTSVVKTNSTQSNTYKFDDAEVDEFVKLLIENWGEEFKEQILEKILLIKNGELKPEFPIPDNNKELMNFLNVKEVSDEKHRDVRKKLRRIADDKTNDYTDRPAQNL